MLVQLPSYAWCWLLSWAYPTSMVRHLAARTIFPRVRRMLLRRSGIRVGQGACLGLGITIIGRSRIPPAVDIGERVAISPHVTFVTSSYPEESVLTRHPEVQGMIQRNAPIRVEPDAWIGTGAILLPGVTIGQCAVVAAGAVVTHDVPPYTVVGGVPARTIRQLRSEEVVYREA